MNPQRHIIQLQQLLKFYRSYFILSSTYFSVIFSSIFQFTHFTHIYVSVQCVLSAYFFSSLKIFYFIFDWRIITILCCFLPGWVLKCSMWALKHLFQFWGPFLYLWVLECDLICCWTPVIGSVSFLKYNKIEMC